MSNHRDKRVTPLRKRLELSSLGVMIGSLLVLVWDASRHSTESQSVWWTLVGATLCLVVLHVANRGRVPRA